MNYGITKIISGGQTGVDRAGLDFAMKHKISIGGWCPRGRRAEDGVIPSKYTLTEHFLSSYPPRTIKNIQSSDGTLILYYDNMEGGTLLTYKKAQQLANQYFVSS